MTDRLCREEKERYIRETEADYKRRAELSRGKIAALEQRRAAAEAAASSLVFFQFQAKQEQRALVRQLDEELLKEKETLASAEKQYKDTLARADEAVKKKRGAFQARAEKEYGLPEEPDDPAMKEYRCSAAPKRLTAYQEEQLAFQKKILDCMQFGEVYLVTDILRELCDPDLRVSKLVSHLTMLARDGKIQTSIKNRKTYFQLA